MDLVVMASAFHLSRACPLSCVCMCVSCGLRLPCVGVSALPIGYMPV